MDHTDIWQRVHALETQDSLAVASGPATRVRILAGWELQGSTPDRPDLPIFFGEGEEISCADSDQARALIAMGAAVAI